MNANIKKSIQAELIHQLRLVWVQADLDVECDTGKDAYTLDVALHTGHFIYGNIAVADENYPNSLLSKYGIVQMVCTCVEDIVDCVEWAVNLQEQHVSSQQVSKVA